jgi:drug/metabolite transporter (DMT)-like permease
MPSDRSGDHLPGRRGLASLPPNLRASLFMIAAFLCFTVMAVLMRAVGPRVPVTEIILIRQVIAFVLLAPWFFAARGQIGAPTGLSLHLARGVFQVGAMGCGLTATLLIPLADVTAIQMAEVIIATALAAIILKEKVGWRRWSAAAIGFVGVLIMLRPFSDGFDAAALIALFGALCGGASMIALRMGSSHDKAITVLFWQGVVVLVLVAPPALWFWVTPTGREMAIIALMGVIFTIGLFLFTAAMRMGSTSAMAPLHYLRLVMMALVGWLLYEEVPSLATAIGATLIIASASYTLMRNARRASKIDPASTSTG